MRVGEKERVCVEMEPTKRQQGPGRKMEES